MGEAVALWILGAFDCLVILAVIVSLWFLTMRRPKKRRTPVFVAGVVTVLVAVFLTKYVPVLAAVVYEPIVLLRHLI